MIWKDLKGFEDYYIINENNNVKTKAFVINDEDFIKLMDKNPNLLGLYQRIDVNAQFAAYYYNQERYDRIKFQIERDNKINEILKQ